MRTFATEADRRRANDSLLAVTCGACYLELQASLQPTSLLCVYVFADLHARPALTLRNSSGSSHQRSPVAMRIRHEGTTAEARRN